MGRNKNNKPKYEEPQLSIDTRLDSYKGFFDHGWLKEVERISRPAPQLHLLVQRLGRSWLIASKTSFMPWLMMEQMRALTSGYNRGKNYDGRNSDIVQALSKRLRETLVCEDWIKNQVVFTLAQVAGELNTRKLPEAVVEIPREYVWEWMIGTSKELEEELKTASAEEKHKAELSQKLFALSLWGLQNQGYAAVFFAYEHFVALCLKRAGNLNKVGNSFESLKNACTNVLGQSATDLYVADRNIHVARLVRNAIAHNGNYETDELRDFGHKYKVSKHLLNLEAPDVHKLYDYLKLKAKSLCELVAHNKGLGYKP